LPSLARTVLLVVMLQTARSSRFRPGAAAHRGGPSGASRPVVLFIFEVAFGVGARYVRAPRDPVPARSWPDAAQYGPVEDAEDERGRKPALSPRPDRALLARGDHGGAADLDAAASFKEQCALMRQRSAPSRRTRSRTTASILQGNRCFRWLINSSSCRSAPPSACCPVRSPATALRGWNPVPQGLVRLHLLGLAIPEQAVILPQHQLFADLRLHNSYPGLILPGLRRAVRRVLHDPIYSGDPARPRRGGDAGRRLALHLVLEGAAAASPCPAQATLGVFTFLGTVEQLLVAAHLGNAQRHVYAHRRPRLGPG
jgi:hypothetical protein